MSKTIAASVIALTMGIGGLSAAGQLGGVADATKHVGQATKDAAKTVGDTTKKAVSTDRQGDQESDHGDKEHRHWSGTCEVRRWNTSQRKNSKVR